MLYPLSYGGSGLSLYHLSFFTPSSIPESFGRVGGGARCAPLGPASRAAGRVAIR